MAQPGFQPIAPLANPTGINPVMSLLGGLASAPQAMQTYEANQQQLQYGQQALADDQTRNATSLIPILQQFAQMNPQWAQSPEGSAAVNKALGPLGFKVPAEGLPATFTSLPVQDFISRGGSSFLEYLRGLPVHERSGWRSMFPNIQNDDFWTKPPAITDPSKLAQWPDLLRKTMDDVGQNHMSVDDAVQWLHNTAPMYNQDPSQFAPQIGQLAQGRASRLAALTGMDSTRAKYIGGLMQAQTARALAGAQYQTAEADAIPQKLSIEAQRAATDAARVANTTADLQMKIESYQKTGLTPATLNAMTSTMRQLGTQVRDVLTARDGLNGQLVKFVQAHNGREPKPADSDYNLYQSLMRQANQLNTQYQTMNAQVQGFQQNYKGIAAQALHHGGAPMNWNPKAMHTEAWQSAGGGSMKVWSTDGGVTWTPDGINFYDKNRQQIPAPYGAQSGNYDSTGALQTATPAPSPTP